MGGFSLKALLLFSSGRGCTWLRKRNRVVRCHVTSCRWARLWTEWVRSLPRLSLCCAGSALLNSLGWNFYSFLKSAVFSILSCSFPFCLFSTFFLVSSSVWEEWNLHNEGKVKTKAFQREPACSFDRLQGPQTRCQNLKGFQLAQARAWRWGSSPGGVGAAWPGPGATSSCACTHCRVPRLLFCSPTGRQLFRSHTCFELGRCDLCFFSFSFCQSIHLPARS